MFWFFKTTAFLDLDFEFEPNSPSLFCDIDNSKPSVGFGLYAEDEKLSNSCYEI